MALNTWWNDDPAQRYWIQITDRKDLVEGVELAEYSAPAGSGPFFPVTRRPRELGNHGCGFWLPAAPGSPQADRDRSSSLPWLPAP